MPFKWGNFKAEDNNNYGPTAQFQKTHLTVMFSDFLLTSQGFKAAQEVQTPLDSNGITRRRLK